MRKFYFQMLLFIGGITPLNLSSFVIEFFLGPCSLPPVVFIRENRTLQQAPWPLKSDRISPEIRIDPQIGVPALMNGLFQNRDPYLSLKGSNMSFDDTDLCTLEDQVSYYLAEETTSYVLQHYGASDVAELTESQIHEVSELAQSKSKSVLRFGLEEVVSIWESHQ